MNPTAILTADMHLRVNPPRNRIDDYFKAQAKKVAFIRALKIKYNVPILDAGDMFDKWNSSPYLEAWALKNLPDDIYAIPGNHELPSHNINNLEKSSLHVLQAAEKICIKTDNINDTTSSFQTPHYKVIGFHWGYDLNKFDFTHFNDMKCSVGKHLAIMHEMVTDVKLQYENTAIMGHALLRKMKGFDLVLTGHNHKPFVIKHEGRLLVNPGSMMRMSKDQIDHKPRVYLWDAKTNEVEPVYLPIEKDVFALRSIKEEEEKNKQLESYITSLNNEYEISLSFKQNMENHLKKNKTRKPVEQLLWRAIL